MERNGKERTERVWERKGNEEGKGRKGAKWKGEDKEDWERKDKEANNEKDQEKEGKVELMKGKGDTYDGEG